MPPKRRYELGTAGVQAPPVPPGFAVRSITDADLDGLARLMLDAYIGTIDYDGEDLEDAVAEVGGFLADETSLPQRSFVLEDASGIVSGVLVSAPGDRPLLGYVMTLPGHKGRGLARLVVAHAVARLEEDGHGRVVLFITEGNTPSERLARSLGAVEADVRVPESRDVTP